MRNRFDQYPSQLAAIERLPEKDKYSKDDLLIPDLNLYQDSNGSGVEIYYIPFDYYQEQAKVSLVGITPGWTQMDLAMRVFRNGLNNRTPLHDICLELVEKASFGGSLRKNLISMLDQLGVNECIGIESASELFTTQSHLIHTTSVLRHPVFVHGENYTGHSPKILKHEKFLEYIDTIFLPEINNVKDSLIIPMGKAVADVLDVLISKGLVDKRRCLLGFPHPSGANGHRKKHFEERRELMAVTVEDWFSSNH